MTDKNRLLGTIAGNSFIPAKDYKHDMIYYFGKWIPAYMVFPMKSGNNHSSNQTVNENE